MAWLFDFLARQGVDPNVLRERCGLSSINELDCSVDGRTHSCIMREALRITGDTGLGLKIGHQRSLATYDQLAYLMMSCATLRESTEKGLKYQNYPGRFSGESIITTFNEQQGQGCYQVTVRKDLADLRLLAVEDLLSNIISTARWVLGCPLPVTLLRCDYPKPPHYDEYKKVFKCPVQFEAPVTQLLFDATILDRPLPHSSPQSVRLYEQLCERTCLTRQGGDVAWRVWKIIAHNPESPPDMCAVAEILHCSPRTLRRRLLAEGWQYQCMVDEIRAVHARRALSNPGLSITQIAQQLGYSDHSGFLRAFKKRTGYTPTAFRKKLFSY